MFDLTRSQRKPYLQEGDIPVAFSIACHVVMRKAWAATEKSFWLFGVAPFKKSCRFQGFTRTAGPARGRKMVENGMANCFTILRRITKLKCVNSEVRSVHIHLKKGSLKLVHAPCRSHHGNHTRQELDHYSDPLGTESHDVQFGQD